MKPVFYSLLLCLAIVVNFSLNAQQTNPVKWEFDVQNMGDQSFLLRFEADLEPGWYIYSHFLESDIALPTNITLTPNPNIEVLSEIQEMGKLLEIEDELLGEVHKKFQNEVVFQQIVKSLSTSNVNLTGKLEYMVCDAYKCLPPAELEFSFELTKSINSELTILPENETPDFSIEESKTYADEDIAFSNDLEIFIPEPSSIEISNDFTENEDWNINTKLPNDMAWEETYNEEKAVSVESVLTASKLTSKKKKEIKKRKAIQKERMLLALAQQKEKEKAEKEAARLEELRRKEAERPKLDNSNHIVWTKELLPTKERGVYTIALEASIDEDWYLYSQNNSKGNAPSPTLIELQNSDSYEIIGDSFNEEGELLTNVDDVFKKTVNRFQNKVKFSQTVRFLKNEPLEVKLSYMSGSKKLYTAVKEQTLVLNPDKSVSLPFLYSMANLWLWAVVFGGLAFVTTIVRDISKKSTSSELS